MRVVCIISKSTSRVAICVCLVYSIILYLIIQDLRSGSLDVLKASLPYAYPRIGSAIQSNLSTTIKNPNDKSSSSTIAQFWTLKNRSDFGTSDEYLNISKLALSRKKLWRGDGNNDRLLDQLIWVMELERYQSMLDTLKVSNIFSDFSVNVNFIKTEIVKFNKATFPNSGFW